VNEVLVVVFSTGYSRMKEISYWNRIGLPLPFTINTTRQWQLHVQWSNSYLK